MNTRPTTPAHSTDERIQREDARGVVDRNTGLGEVVEDNQTRMASGEDVRGGDRHTDAYQAKVSGDEAVGGTVITPDTDLVDDIGASAGVEHGDREDLKVYRKLANRDENRWELDRDSAGDRS